MLGFAGSIGGQYMTMNVWVVDDSPMILDIVGAIVTDMGHSVTGFSSATDAVANLEGSAIDLVISDVHMPVMDGFELTRHIRAHESLSTTPVLLLSADSTPTFADHCRSAGVTAWVKKPFQPADLERQLSRFLSE
jgi:CheY-like chemotaxis protein